MGGFRRRYDDPDRDRARDRRARGDLQAQLLPGREERLVVSVDYTAWGWVYLVVGVVVVLAGDAVMTGAMWARLVGICLAGLSVILNIAFLAAYPFWSLMIITLDVLIIYALAVHGRELKS